MDKLRGEIEGLRAKVQELSGYVSEQAKLKCAAHNEACDLRAVNAELLEALEIMREAYQRMFDVMPVAWQTFDDIAEAALAKARS